MESNGESVEAVLQFIFPVRCAGCGEYDPAGLCQHCRARLTDVPPRFALPGVEGGISLGGYTWPLREAIHSFKFKSVKILGKTLGLLMSHRIADQGWRVDGIAPVPMSSSRRRERGYNPAGVLAESCAEALAIPCLDLLRVARPIRHQVGLGKAERGENVKGAFAALRDAPIAGRSLLLLDDVVTTGATVAECAGVLKACGAARVYAASIALDAPEGPA